MARQILEKLIEGDREIISQIERVKIEWNNLLINFNWNDENAVNTMATIVSQEQLSMEYNVGERWLGQEIMVFVGIAQFYSTKIGFEENYKKAKIVYDGFLRSMCSLEVKSNARTIGNIYGLTKSNEDIFW